VRNVLLAVCCLLFVVAPASSLTPADEVARDLWPAEFRQLADFGRGKAIVFTPDLAPSGNREFYERLGFAYLESTSWRQVFAWLREMNRNPDSPQVNTLVLEVHGSNGHGLTLQSGRRAGDERSYASIGALEEQLSGTGIGITVVGTCNAGRLFRPSIARMVDRNRGRDVLPATREIVDASPEFVRGRSGMVFIRRQQSHLEPTIETSYRELNGAARTLLPRLHGEFAVSALVIQLLLDDPELRMAGEEWVEQVSLASLPDEKSQTLMDAFVNLVNRVAAEEIGRMRPIGLGAGG
jgi:hypothetical protein